MLCKVCKTEMRSTGNPALFTCNLIREVPWEGSTGTYRYWDFLVHYNDYGQLSTQRFEFPPYKITVKNYCNMTLIEKAIPRRETMPHNVLARPWEFQEVLMLNTIIELPWEDLEQVRAKIKNYLIFS